MTTSDIIDIAAISISGVFALISAVAAIYSVRASRRSNDIQKEMLRIEQQRDADMLVQRQTANVIPRLESKDPLLHLILMNTGSSSAHNVTVTLNGQSIDDISWIEKKKPLKDVVLGAGVQHRLRVYNIARSDYRPPPWDIAITWDDKSGEPGNYQTTLDR